MTTTEILFSLAVGILLVVVVSLAFSLSRADAEIKELNHYLDQAEDDLRVTEDALGKISLAVTPLVEKTDWMTGRWGGQFSTLVAMENARNVRVDEVRRAMMNTPLFTRVGTELFDEVPVDATLAWDIEDAL